MIWIWTKKNCSHNLIANVSRQCQCYMHLLCKWTMQVRRFHQQRQDCICCFSCCNVLAMIPWVSACRPSSAVCTLDGDHQIWIGWRSGLQLNDTIVFVRKYYSGVQKLSCQILTARFFQLRKYSRHVRMCNFCLMV